jgi:quercetin dioxygenase-like cupin family protein
LDKASGFRRALAWLAAIPSVKRLGGRKRFDNSRRVLKNDVQEMEIKRSGSQPSNKGPADWFTGNVRIDPLFEAPEPARVRGAQVTFEPGARTAWHTHPLGQTLIVTSGVGRTQRWSGPIEEIRPGDVVWISPGEKHWHGASPTTAMTHIAIQEALNGKPVDWMEKVTDEQYQGKN